MTTSLLLTIIGATVAVALITLVVTRAASARETAMRELLDRERELAARREADAEAQRAQLVEQFKALSVDALDANGKRFLELATQQLEQQRVKAEGDLKQRQQAIGELVKPVAAKLAEVDQKITAFDKAREGTERSLTAQLAELRRNSEQLRDGASALTKALRQPQGRGRWGEMQLRRVVEVAGLHEHTRDFTVQHSTLTDEERRLRPDMVVNLPSGRCVVVDSKVPLDAFLEAMEAPDDEAAEPQLQRHAEQVRTHVAQLAKKDYSQHLDGALPDMVVLFLPAEHLFAAAVQQQPGIVEEAFDKGVVIASPTTLLTLLHAIAQGWKEERLARNAEQIAALGRELHERVAVMADKFARVGKGLDTASKAYNEAIGSLESRVLPTARKFEELDAAKASKEIPELSGTTHVLRALAAPEFVERLAERDVAQDVQQDPAGVA
ncbi:MAG: DNA recombination protein RmuC [Thermoleophilia bacterium]|nr:DNA recombination protein RmuC [Thermoleophilia bacterium]